MRPYVGAALAADAADEPRLDVGQPHIVGPAVRYAPFESSSYFCGLPINSKEPKRYSSSASLAVL
jgi:hypothetical protein